MTDARSAGPDRPHGPARRRSKRSRVVPMTLMGAAALSMAACEDDRVETRAFASVEECASGAGAEDAWFDGEACVASFEEARAEHERTAPRYVDAALCEEEHGGACYERTGSGGSSIFLPLMAGYLMGNMLGRTGASSARAQPVYRTAAGRFATPGGTSMSSLRGVSAASPAAFRAAPAAAAPMTRATVRSTGGFGASRTSVSGRGSYGG